VSIKSQIANLLRDMRDQLQLALLFIAHDLATVLPVRSRDGALPWTSDGGRTAAALYGAPRHPYTRATGGQSGA
jgi:ABC-type oligopeptide transport system ATPase subunit